VADEGGVRWPELGAAQEAFFLQRRAHRVARDRPAGETIGQVTAGPRHVHERHQLVGAVFRQEVVVEVDLAQFPGVLQQAAGFRGCEGEFVFPDVAVFQVVVLLHLLVIRRDGEQARITAEQALGGEHHAIGLVGLGSEVDGVGIQARGLGLLRVVHAQQGMAEAGGGIVQVGRREDERHLARVDGGVPGLEARTVLFRQARRIERQAFLEPLIARDETALRMLPGGCLFAGDPQCPRRPNRGV
jgi:hypothetical protein